MNIEKTAIINTLVNNYNYDREELEEYTLKELKIELKSCREDEDCFDEMCPNETWEEYCEHENFGC